MLFAELSRTEPLSVGMTSRTLGLPHMELEGVNLVLEGQGEPGQMGKAQGTCGEQGVRAGPSPGRSIDFGFPSPKSCAATHMLCKICNDPISKQEALRIRRNGWGQMCEADRKAVRVAKQDALEAGRKEWLEQLEKENPAEKRRVVIGLREHVAVSQRGRKRSRVDFCKIVEEQKRFKRGVDDGVKRMFLSYNQYCDYWQGKLPGVVPPVVLLDAVEAGKQWHRQMADPASKKRQSNLSMGGRPIELLGVEVEHYSLEETGAEVSKQLHLESVLKEPSAAAISASENELMAAITLSFDDPIFDTSAPSRPQASSSISSKPRPAGKEGTKEPGKGKSIGGIPGSGKPSHESVLLSVELKVNTLFGLLDAMVPKWKALIDEGTLAVAEAKEAGPSNGVGPSPGCLAIPPALAKMLQRRVPICFMDCEEQRSRKGRHKGLAGLSEPRPLLQGHAPGGLCSQSGK